MRTGGVRRQATAAAQAMAARAERTAWCSGHAGLLTATCSLSDADSAARARTLGVPSRATPLLPTKRAAMAIPIDVSYSRAFGGTSRRIFQLLSDMGTSGDAIWPFAAQPFMRTSGPLVVGTTEEWHLGMHSILAEVVPEERIVWRIANDGVTGTHGFFLSHEGKKTIVTHQTVAELSDSEGRMFWKRLQDSHERAIDGLFDKIARVLKR